MPHTSHTPSRLAAAVLGLGLVASTGLAAAPVAVAKEAPIPAGRNQALRPQFHYSAAANWSNDPNGMVYYQGQYHLFYQHNPLGNDWGNMSWGHAVSTDLVHWRELSQVAIPYTSEEGIFSGSIVVDERNTTGFGRPGHPALVAVYTSARAGNQSQALAYSTDGGNTFTKYTGNPVLDIGSGEFRDPKVFWDAARKRWVMVAVKATEHKVAIYSSPNLKQWTHESDFGPLNATGGVWECPDLFPMPTGRGGQKWVMLVNLNPGGPQGGSATQYFVGSFDGHSFTADDKPYTPVAGDTIANFDDGSYDGWTASGDAFGSAPATGNLPGQAGVQNFTGRGFVNSFHNADAGTGTLSSPEFTITKKRINFMVGGGNHPRVPGAVPGGRAPSGTVLADFESTAWPAGWTATGDLATYGPAAGTIGDQQQVTGYQGERLVNTFLDHDATTGTLTSPAFTLSTKKLSLLVGGGDNPMTGPTPTAVNLLVDGKVVRTATGNNSEALNWVTWDLADLQGKKAQVQVVDQSSAGWGHILVDQIVASDDGALPAATDTTVNLVVGGTVVRSTTGADSEALDWRSWDVAGLVGQKATIEVVDHNTGGYGHILADQFSQSDTAALTSVQRAHWLDQGADHYAAVTFNNAPGERRIAMAWLSNWQYAGSIPTSPWRGSFTVPRDLTLARSRAGWVLRSNPVPELARQLEHSRPLVLRHALVSGTRDLPVKGTQLDLRVTLDLGHAEQAGLDVRAGDGQYTRIGVDRRTHELFIDRTHSGQTGFSTVFPAVHRAPLPARGDTVQLRILVDRDSVEVFADGGLLAMTDLVLPERASAGVRAFATDGVARMDLTALRVGSIWAR